LFSDVCHRGQLEMAKWLYDQKELSVKILEKGLCQACEEGHINIVKWICNNNIKKLNALEIAVKNHEVYIVKHLLEFIQPHTLSYIKHRPFFYACRNHQTQIAILLRNFNPTIYQLTVENYDIINYHADIRIFIDKSENEYVKEYSVCTICYCNEARTKINCGHIICYECVTDLCQKGMECPYCREVIEKGFRVFKKN